VVVVRRAAIAAALLLAACEPDIGSGVYYCGPERACPDGLRCDDATALCVFPDLAEPFACETHANDYEPDDTPDAAGDVGIAGCGAVSINGVGCIDTADDVDHFAFVTPLSCDGQLEVLVRFPVAFQPLAVDLIDEAGEVLGVGTVCDELDEFGETRVCAEAEVAPEQRVMLRVTADPDGADCDGSCAFNGYQLSIL
jgi:hypothetical protein